MRSADSSLLVRCHILSTSSDILKQFDTDLEKGAVPFSLRADYRKWLRYYFDVRTTYQLPNSRPEQMRLFVEKLQAKNHTSKQQQAEQHGKRDEEPDPRLHNCPPLPAMAATASALRNATACVTFSATPHALS